MSYDPTSYWMAAGSDPANSEHESHFRRTETFARQEERLMATLRTLEFRSILEVGCGWGRITRLVHDEWPDVPYLAIDMSAERIASARKKAPGVRFVRTTIQGYDQLENFALVPEDRFDLVLTVECLMHVLPAEIEEVVTKLFALSSGYVVSLDWAVPLGNTPIAPWNFLHPYEELYGKRLRSVEQVGLQAIYVAEIEKSEPKVSLKPAKAKSKPKASLKP